MTTLSVLEREMYSEAEAARLLGVAQSTLHYWLEGGERRGKTYPPVIRPEPHGHRTPVTWAEFVEARPSASASATFAGHFPTRLLVERPERASGPGAFDEVLAAR